MYVQRKTQERIDRAQQPGQSSQPAASGEGDADPLIREASSRLAQSKAGAGVANLPMMFVIGDKGTAKTSSLLNSGLDPELLAGQVYQDNVVAPTRGREYFFRARNGVRGSGRSADGESAIVDRASQEASTLAPEIDGCQRSGSKRRSPVLRSRNLHPRRCDRSDRQRNAVFTGPARRNFRNSRHQLSRIHTLHPRRPHSFFRRICSQFEPGRSRSGGRCVPCRSAPPRPADLFGTGSAAAHRAFNQLFHSFCDHRLLLLPREGDATKLPQAYEFPREFRNSELHWSSFWSTSAGPASCGRVRSCAAFIFPE